MQLVRNHPLPLHVQLLEALRAEIRNLQPDQKLPSERELCERFDVSRMTVRQALGELTREGLIYSRAGRGSFVSRPKIEQHLGALTGFSQDARARGSHASSRILEARVIPANEHIAAKLRVSPGSQVILLARVRMADALPLAHEAVYLPRHLCPGLLRHDFTAESLYGVLEQEYGLRLARADQTMEAALADPKELAMLDLAPPAPVLILERTTFTYDEVIVEHVHSVYRGDRFRFHTTLEAHLARFHAATPDSVPST